jgi:hypothetical protein
VLDIVILSLLIVAGKLLAVRFGLSDFDRWADLALPYVLLVFVVAAAIPFIPGAEIGFGLLMVFGADVALAVYFSMLSALMLAFLIGRFVSPAPSRQLTHFIVTRWRVLRMRLHRKALGQSGPKFIAALQILAANKHATLGVALNTPGNSILGGGGGLAFIAGASKEFSFLGFGLTASIAVLPIPLFFYFFG